VTNAQIAPGSHAARNHRSAGSDIPLR
jgi:hypothetical protein